MHAEELLRIFIPCPKQLNANCRPSGSSYKKGRDIQEGGMAFGIGVKLHSDICVALSQPIDLMLCNISSKSPECNQSYLFGGGVVYRQ